MLVNESPFPAKNCDFADKENADLFMELAKKYTDFEELTPAMINEFVSKIVVHKAEGIGAGSIWQGNGRKYAGNGKKNLLKKQINREKGFPQ